MEELNRPSALIAREQGVKRGVFGLLEDSAESTGNSLFLVDRFTQLTFDDALDRSRRLASWLRSRGVSRGDRVVICMDNRVETALAVFATASLGAVFVVLNSKLKAKGLQKILQQVSAKACIADENTMQLFSAPFSYARLLVAEKPEAQVQPEWTSWHEAMKLGNETKIEWPGIDVDPACIVFTSGSTSDPRGVTLSHDNIRFVVAAIQERLGYRPDDTIGCFLPFAFDYGLYQVFLAAQAGATLYVGTPEDVGPRLPAIMRQAEITVLPGVPTVYAALIALGRRQPLQLPVLRAITNTGERLPLTYIEQLRAMIPGLQVFPMYGLTECKRVSILLPSEFESKRESVGRALPGTEVYAIDADGARLAPGETGQLVVRGRHVALGYWQAAEETAQRFRKRAPEAPVELFTGDTGFVDNEGFIFFGARNDDLLKHRGTRVSPLEIEVEACAISGVIEAAVVKRESDDTLHLFVTISDSSMNPETILQQLNHNLEPAKIPDVVRVMPSLPKTINGKLDKKALHGLIAS
jgi:acyl-coenzyme A synthetase/AMP-(fatty) acid ligase